MNRLVAHDPTPTPTPTPSSLPPASAGPARGTRRSAPNAATACTAREEHANALTHGVGAVLAVVAVAGLLIAASRDGDPLRIATLAVFGGTMVAVYGLSTVYHLARRPRLKVVLRRFDHAAIFLLIAGTYTPLMLVPLGGAWGWVLFGVVWGMAAVGLTLKFCCFDRFGWTQLGLTLVMGWLIVLAAPVMIPALSTAGLLWLAAGGLAYTVGVGFFLWERLPYSHAVWHLFVIAGSGCHVMAMVHDVLPGGGTKVSSAETPAARGRSNASSPGRSAPEAAGVTAANPPGDLSARRAKSPALDPTPRAGSGGQGGSETNRGNDSAQGIQTWPRRGVDSCGNAFYAPS